MTTEKKISIKKPRGRVPKGKTWDSIDGKWIDQKLTLNKPLNQDIIDESYSNDIKNQDPLEINKIIIKELETLRQKEFANNDKIRVMAYNKAIKVIKDYFSNTAIQNGNQLKEYKGIGDKIAKKVDEIIEKGVLESAEEARKDDKVKAINLFSDIHGIGPENAQRIVNLNITSIDELNRRKDEIQENGKPLLNRNQQLGLKYYKPLLTRIPRSEMILHEEMFNSVLEDINKKFPGTSLEVVGSFRRGLPDSGDIDVLITNSYNKDVVFNTFIKKLEENKYIIDVLGHGKKKFFGVSKLNKDGIPRRLDILYTTPNEFPFAQLYFTGSGSFNTLFREYVSNLGYRLNEYKLQHYNPNQMPKLLPVDHEFKNEKDIFDFFKIPFIEPQNRDSHILNQELNKIKNNQN
jgi:DNA polymerase/3'-5' exonuclease PolX